MKSLHRPDLYGWSIFDSNRNIDFNGIAWIRPSDNILIDPVPLSAHDWRHLQSLGGADWIVITNSDHLRDTIAIAQQTGAQVAAPQAERTALITIEDSLGSKIRWLGDGDELVPQLQVMELSGSKTPGELALLLGGHTLITGDLIRAPRAGDLTLLPDAKLQNRAAAIASVQRLASLEGIEAVLVGDGWSIFRDGHDRLQELLQTLIT
ncbi:MBL fold metallo-hydrolase [Alkalinema sp. FACHB-956]|uniref:MBL fold metallo-hydrolase n=1 Tax=Alkalinema sp. FACHB-956 TaxID=2692768 RepID=UPI0016852EBD|nr:MBL fold metallo-hydrolase [Alkalinema sp. FACHB-956]MBD2329218.1 MBL fold metallo-hydrolase [Alkalinema sp. FACHB-956]